MTQQLLDEPDEVALCRRADALVRVDRLCDIRRLGGGAPDEQPVSAYSQLPAETEQYWQRRCVMPKLQLREALAGDAKLRCQRSLAEAQLLAPCAQASAHFGCEGDGHHTCAPWHTDAQLSKSATSSCAELLHGRRPSPGSNPWGTLNAFTATSSRR